MAYTMHHDDDLGRPVHCRNAAHCIVPPFLGERLAQSKNKKVRDAALRNLQVSSHIRGFRSLAGGMPRALIPYAGASPSKAKIRREIYHQGNREPAENNTYLPGQLVRPEGGPRSKDPAVNEAYDFSGATWKFYNKVFGRNSIDDAGMTLVNSVHAGRGYDNAFWNGYQMVYGDGDGIVFRRFTASLDVVGHELTHGVVQFGSGLTYHDEPGALNEHFADVFGSLVKQYKKRQTAAKADWLIGREILVPAPTRTALRSMKDPGTAFQNDPDLGTDPQPKHYANRYTGGLDYGGVHINSGIPNHAFYLAATKIGGNAWEKAGRVWYKVMHDLLPESSFADCAAQSRMVAESMFGASSSVAKAIDTAWTAVGL